MYLQSQLSRSVSSNVSPSYLSHLIGSPTTGSSSAVTVAPANGANANPLKFVRRHHAGAHNLVRGSACCRNCGQLGHLYRDCPHPITSFGIICYRMNARGEPEYLMYQRKDSLSFMEFIRGKYELIDVNYIRQLLMGMTQQERGMLLTMSFEQLWNHVWFQATIPRHTSDFEQARVKFETLFQGYYKDGLPVRLTDLLATSPSPYNEPEWGFPKGRRRLREDDVPCAVREFTEETGFTSCDLTMVPNCAPFEEIFFGTNRVLYRHTYFLAEFTGTSPAYLEVDPANVGQAREVRALCWLQFDDVLSHIRSHNQERKELFRQVHQRICDIESRKGKRPSAVVSSSPGSSSSVITATFPSVIRYGN